MHLFFCACYNFIEFLLINLCSILKILDIDKFDITRVNFISNFFYGLTCGDLLKKIF